MGGRSSDPAGRDFTHPFEYDPGDNSWTTKSATYPDNQVNNMACGVLIEAERLTFIAWAARQPGRRLLPIACSVMILFDVSAPLLLPGPATADGTILPGGFAVFQQQALYTGWIDIIGGSGDKPIWEFTPEPTHGCRRPPFCLFRLATYRPPPLAGSSTPVGAAISRRMLTDTTNSFVYNRWVTLSAPLPAYRGPQARRERLPSTARCSSWVAAGSAQSVERGGHL